MVVALMVQEVYKRQGFFVMSFNEPTVKSAGRMVTVFFRLS